MDQPTAPEAPPSSARTSLGLIFVIVFIDLLGFAIVLPLLPRYAERFHADNLTIGLLFSSFSIMQFIFAPLWGRLSDRIGRRPVLLVGLFGSVVFYALFGIATIYESLPLMFASRIGAGIAGATISTAQAYVADATGPAGRARGMALIGAAFGIGFTFGPILGSIAMPSAPPSPGELPPLNSLPGFIASGLSLLALIVGLLKLKESLRPGAASATAKHAWLNIGAFRSAVAVPSVGALLLMVFLSTFAFAQFESTLSRLTESGFHLNERDNFLLFTFVGVVVSIMQGLVVRALAPVMGEPRMILLGVALMCGGLFVIALAAHAPTIPLLLAGVSILVAGFAFTSPSSNALISRRSDPARQGEIMGLNQSATAMARILGPVCGNLLFGAGLAMPYTISAALLVPAFLMAVVSVNAGKDFGSTSSGGPDAPASGSR